MSSSTQYASRNQLANVLDISRPTVDHLLLVAGVLSLRRKGKGIELQLTKAGRMLTDPEAPFESFNIEKVRALMDKYVAPDLGEHKLNFDLPDEFISRSQLCGLMNISDTKLCNALVDAGIFYTPRTSLRAGKPTPKSTGMIRPNRAKGIYDFNAKRIGAALKAAGVE